MAFLSGVLAALGSLVAGLGSQGCLLWLIDEPKCPKSLIK